MGEEEGERRIGAQFITTQGKCKVLGVKYHFNLAQVAERSPHLNHARCHDNSSTLHVVMAGEKIFRTFQLQDCQSLLCMCMLQRLTVVIPVYCRTEVF